MFLGGLAATAGLAVACCAVSSTEKVAILAQKNIIIWNPETKTESFVRNAKFETGAKNFGFITPTPSVPKLDEVDPEAFKNLDAVIKEYEDKLRSRAKSAGGSTASAVEVIQAAKVAGYDAVTLKASDASALAEWMRKHDYHTTLSIQNWTDFYIKKGWYLTAFKVAAEKGRAETGLVKMTFKTETPFNPYYVPADNISANATGKGLAVYFIGPGIYDATDPRTALRNQTAVRLSPLVEYVLRGQLKMDSFPKTPVVTLMIDAGFPRESSDDVFFELLGPEAPSSAKGWFLLAGLPLLLVLRRKR